MREFWDKAQSMLDEHFEEYVEDKAKEAVGNWKEFDCFVWDREYEEDFDAENWTIVYTENRDSDVLTRANARVMTEELGKEEFADDVLSEHHNHWACGWIDGFAVRVYNKNREITPAFRKLCELEYRKEDYPVLDDDLYSQMEFDDYQESWNNWGSWEFKKQLERWVENLEDEKFTEFFDSLESADFDNLWYKASQYISWEYQDGGGSGVNINVKGGVEWVQEQELEELKKIVENGKNVNSNPSCD